MSVAEAQKKNEEMLQKEEKRAKERKATLRGVITFAKKVWKELPIQDDIFK